MEPTTPTVFRSLLTRKVCRYGLIIQPVLIKLDQRDEAYREILSVNGLTQTHNAAPFVSRRGPWSLIRRHATVFLPSPDPPDKSRYACPRIVTDRSIGEEGESHCSLETSNGFFAFESISLFSPGVNQAFTLVHLSIAIVW